MALSNRLPPISPPTTTGLVDPSPQRISLPPLSAWSDGFRVTSPFPSSPAYESSPPRTPFTTRHHPHNPTVQSSPSLPMAFHPLDSLKVVGADASWPRNEMPTASSHKPKASSLFSLLDPIPPSESVSPSEPLPRPNSKQRVKPQVYYLSSPPRSTLSSFPPANNSPEGDQPDQFISEFSTRSTYFRTSAERGQWKTDPHALRSHTGSFVTQVNLRTKLSVKRVPPTPASTNSPTVPAHSPVPRSDSYQIASSEQVPHSDISSDLEDRDTPYSDVPQTLPSLSSDRDSSVDTYGCLSPLPPSSPLLSPEPQLPQSLPSPDLAPDSPTIPVSSPLSSIPSPLPAEVDVDDNSEFPKSDETPHSPRGFTSAELHPEKSDRTVSVSSPTPVHVNNDAPDRSIGVNITSSPDVVSRGHHQGQRLGSSVASESIHRSTSTSMSTPTPMSRPSSAAPIPTIPRFSNSRNVETTSPSSSSSSPAPSLSLSSLDQRALKPRPDNESRPLKAGVGAARAKPLKAADEKCENIAPSVVRRANADMDVDDDGADADDVSRRSPMRTGGLKKRKMDEEEDTENDVNAGASASGTKKRKEARSSSQGKGRRRAKSRALSEALADVTEDALASCPITAFDEPEICGMIIEGLATSRASSLPLSTLYRQVMQSRPALHAQRSDREWLAIFVRVLEGGERSSGVFGKVESSFKDDSDKPLEARWFYVPESDPDQERATLIRSMMPRPGKRSETKKYKQYYYRPLGKISRWDAEDEL